MPALKYYVRNRLKGVFTKTNVEFLRFPLFLWSYSFISTQTNEYNVPMTSKYIVDPTNKEFPVILIKNFYFFFFPEPPNPN